jgi:hypothetical protein
MFDVAKKKDILNGNYSIGQIGVWKNTSKNVSFALKYQKSAKCDPGSLPL